MRFDETRGITAGLLMALKKPPKQQKKNFHDLHSDVYEFIWFKLRMMIDTSLIDLDLDSRSQECKKAKASAPIVSQSFQSIWRELGSL